MPRAGAAPRIGRIHDGDNRPSGRWLRRLGLILCGIAACGGGGRSPAAAVRALAEAAQGGDVEEVWRRLGPGTRARLTLDAQRAGEQAGRRPIAPRDLVAIGWTAPRAGTGDVREVSRDGDKAVVEIVGRRGERERVDVVRERDGWKVELP